MPKGKKDHYVAQTYLKRFCDNKGNIYAFSKKSDRVLCTNTRSICWEWDWDTLKGVDNETLLAELLNGHLEPTLNNVIDRLIYEKIDDRDKYHLSVYFSILHFLNPHFIKNKQFKEEKLELIVKDIYPNLSDYSNLFNKDYNSKRAELFAEAFRLASILYISQWQVITNNSDLNFLTSDRPIEFFPLNSIGSPQPRFIALDPRHALVIDILTSEIMQQLKDDKIDIPAGAIKHIKLSDRKKIKKYILHTISTADRFIISQENNSKIEKFVKRYKSLETKQDVKPVIINNRRAILLGPTKNF